MSNSNKVAFLFPGQGAQIPGMGKEFYETFNSFRETLEEADDVIEKNISKIILHGPEKTLTETKNSQVALYVVSSAMLRVIHEMFDELKPYLVAGLSLGEYTALYSGGYYSFQEGLKLVKKRGEFMNDACEETVGLMLAVIGLTQEQAEELVEDIDMPDDLWAANFNCPGQVVLSGTFRGIEKAKQMAHDRGARRVLPLQVHGAFHSGLMQSAEDRLKPYIERVALSEGTCPVVMNVTSELTKDANEIKKNLIKQVTHSVRWNESINTMEKQGTELYLEIGPGKVLSGFNKRIKTIAPTVAIEKPQDLEQLGAWA